MKLLRFLSVVALVALMNSPGSTTARTDSLTVPDNLIGATALDLRAVGSQLVVQTIEDALRQGGLALFDEGFQFESSLNWVFGETIEGEVDVVVPLWSADGHALFAQPGVVFWTGLAEAERIDGNFGAVYRTELADGVVGGGSFFYDYDFQYGHSRIGGGIDIQSGIFQGGFNYYHPLDEWDEGRTDYEEQALRGADFRVALEREVMRLSANLSYWRFEGEEDVKTDWKPSYGFDAGFRIAPGVFLEGGWERHDEMVSLDERWNAGLAFRFSLPDFRGASYGEGGLSSNLWKFVEREKRILYEERLGIPRVNLTASQQGPVTEPTAADGSETVTIEADLGKPLDEDIVLHIMVAETSTATLGEDEDFTYGHKVYELDEATGEQSAPSGEATPCPEDRMMACEVMVPAGVTRFDIEANIAMTTEREVREFIDFQVEVPEEYAGLVQGSFVERVTIEAHGNKIMFDPNAATTLMENDEREGVEVLININRPSPTPFTLNVAPTSPSTPPAVEGEDYRISTRSLAIPANASRVPLMLYGINNEVGEGSKEIVLTLSSSNLPEGWEITGAEHTVTLQDDDLSVFVAPATPGRIAEPADGAGDVTRMVTVGITQPPPSNVTVTLSAMGETRGTADSGTDFAFSDTDIMFTQDGETMVTREIMIADDSTAEGDETIILTLTDPTNSLDGTGFSLAGTYTITIPANDNTVGFASDAPMMLVEKDETTQLPTSIAVAINVNQAATEAITLNIQTTGTANLGEHYNISTRSLRIPAGQTSGTITLMSIDNEDTGAPEIILTIPQSQSLPDGWTLGTATHKVTLVDDEVRIVSLTHDQTDTDVTHRHTVRMTIRMSAALEEDVMLNITLGGKTSEYVDVWTIRYNSVPADQVPPAVFAGGTQCGSKSSLMCQVTLSEGETLVDLNLIFTSATYSGSDPTRAGITVALASGHPSNVRLGDSSSVTFTVTERCGATSCNS